MSGGSSLTLRLTRSTNAPSKGSRPLSASKRMMPTLYQSEAIVAGSPAACSGDMYSIVPRSCGLRLR